MKNKTTIILLIILIILVAIGLIYLIFLKPKTEDTSWLNDLQGNPLTLNSNQNQTPTNNNQQINSDPTTSWKTVTNSGLTIKYPSNLETGTWSGEVRPGAGITSIFNIYISNTQILEIGYNPQYTGCFKKNAQTDQDYIKSANIGVNAEIGYWNLTGGGDIIDQIFTPERYNYSRCTIIKDVDIRAGGDDFSLFEQIIRTIK
ncbi:MAG: hypothetical protein WDK96_02715 [Candidatus Paceibacterota bacterium]|jgi:hypothetical protein